ncbi:MAG TPA: AMP-binding protein [Rhodospirillaceae bacterium]|nr:AMP-binding protein [Rhodospirillaceae bacterium]
MVPFDSLEVRSADERQAALAASLPGQIAWAKAKATHFAALLADCDPARVTSLESLARLPVTRKSALIEMQRALPPFGGLNALPLPEMAHIFASPGPIYDPQGKGADWWRLARALHAAGFVSGDLIHNAFSYHFTPGGMMFDAAAQALRCPVFPAGVGNTEQQARALHDLRPAAYVGTPSFLKIILEKAQELGLDHHSLSKACVSGEGLPPSLRQSLADFGVSVRQCYATADLGLIAYESHALDGLISDEGVVVEIVRPGTGDPVPDGEVGEVVVTTLSADYPLVRFATGDLSTILSGCSPCGRTNRRIKGWMGRADQTAKVRGMFVHPSQVADIQKRHPEILRARLVIERDQENDRMTLHCELSAALDLVSAVQSSIQAVCKLKGDVVLHPPGSLANDGLVIADLRN